jgi:hypothetical protein
MPATGSLLGAEDFQKSEVDKVARLRQAERIGVGRRSRK